MSHPSQSNARPQSSAPVQNTVFRRPCFQIAVHASGDGARLGVQVVAAPAQRR